MGDPISREEHEEFVKRMEGDHKRIDKRLELLEESVRQIGALTTSVEMGYVLTAVVSVLVGFAATRLGLT